MKNFKLVSAYLSIFLSTLVLVGSLLSPEVFATSTWGTPTETSSVGQSTNDWYDSASSSSGEYQAAVTYNDGIYVSSDYGQTWTNETASDSYNDSDWYGVAISATGQYQAADGYSGIYVSSDYGQTWTNEASSDPLSSVSWDMISMSSSGQYLLASTDEEGIYVSSDYGQTWTNEASSGPLSDIYIWKPAMSSSGQIMYVADYYAGDLYQSTDYGQTWSQVQTGLSISDSDLYFIATSSSGQDIVMANYTGDVYSSSNAGQSWTDMTNGTGISSVYPVSISGSGEYITLGAYEGGLYVSQNSSLAPVNNTSLNNASNGAAVSITTHLGTSITCATPVTAATLAVKDQGYSYPLGLVNICYSTINSSDQVSLAFVTNLTPTQVTARDYNSSSQKWTTIPGAVITQTSLNGQPALELTYTIADNGLLDSSSTVGLVNDPVGLAVSNAPDTGFGSPSQINPWLTVGLVVFPLMSFMVIGMGLRRLGRTSNK